LSVADGIAACAPLSGPDLPSLLWPSPLLSSVRMKRSWETA